MITPLSAVRLTLVVTGGSLLGVAVWVARSREATTLRPFVLLVGVLGVFAVLDGVAAADPTALSLVWLTAYLTIPGAFAWFVVEYYGLPHLASPRRALAFAAPVVVGWVGGATLILNPASTGAMFGGAAGPGPAMMPRQVLVAASFAERLGLFYAGGGMLAAIGLLVRTTGSYDHLDARLGAVLSFVPVWPWAAYLLTPAFVGAYPQTWLLAGTAAGYGLSAGAAAFAVTRGGLFDAAPAAGTLGPETVLEHLDDAVVVVDRQERIVRTNAAVEHAFEPTAATTAGRPLPDLLGVSLDEVREMETIELPTAGGTRTFEPTVNAVRDRHGRTPGFAVVLRDVTRQRVRAQRLSVLNRVLRHNLRNEMSAIIGRAEVIAHDSEGHEDVAEAILSAADDLVSLGDRAREVEEMMSVDPVDATPASLAAVVEAVLDPYRSTYPEAAISADLEPNLSVAVPDRVLSQVLENLVDNALEHNDAPKPVVTVSARATSENTVTLSVADNGPGLPEQERTALEAGEESPLEHGSGIGLWAVKWGATRMGADISFADNEPRGTVVSLSLPRATAVESDDTASAAASSAD